MSRTLIDVPIKVATEGMVETLSNARAEGQLTLTGLGMYLASLKEVRDGAYSRYEPTAVTDVFSDLPPTPVTFMDMSLSFRDAGSILSYMLTNTYLDETDPRQGLVATLT